MQPMYQLQIKSMFLVHLKGKLSSVDGQRYSIHNMSRQLFGGIEGGSVKDVNLANVDINMSLD